MTKIQINKYKDIIWYGLCIFFLGIIDQRRGSAAGHVQLLFANLVGVAVFCFVLPSMKKEFWQCKAVKIQAIISCIGLPIFCMAIRPHVANWSFWNTGAIDVVLAGFLVAYVIWDRQNIFTNWSVIKSGYFVVMLMLLLMILSVNNTVWPGLYLLLFGCFYLIGIPKDKQEYCVLGILSGLVLWFVVLQVFAFGFRHFDYIRYRGAYKGETQNGLFYMVVFCAWIGLWLYARYKGCKKIWMALAFLLAACSAGLLLLTGGKSSLLGAVLGGTTAFLLYDLYIKKSLKHWLLQLCGLGVCILVLFPAMYGCVRYLPTVLHHPVWFDGEYDDDRCVRSFDPKNSERYITFEQVVEKDLGRILKYIGVTIEIEDGQWHIQTPLSIKSDAAEPGSSKDNPYLSDKTPKESDGKIDPARVAIWRYFFKNLNFEGHNRVAFYYREGRVFVNAHNMFLHIAAYYGIIPGVLFLGVTFWCLVRLLKRKDMTGIVLSSLMIAIITYGMFEQATTTGQITLSMLFILYYFGLQKQIK